MGAWGASACEKLQSLPEPRVEELVEVMKDGKASEMKQLMAFEELACSDKPAIRKFVIDAGLGSSNKTLRGQALAVLMLQRDQVKVELLEVLKDDSSFNSFMQSNGRDVAYRFYFPNPAQNCVSLFSIDKCPGENMLVVDGLTVRIKSSQTRMTATFILQPDNSLRGSVLVDRSAKAVPAKIELFK